MAVYLEIESLEWIENSADEENRILITSGNGRYGEMASHYNKNVMNILNEHSEDGWEVVHFTDTFNYIEKNVLQRRKCYFLRKS